MSGNLHKTGSTSKDNVPKSIREYSEKLKEANIVKVRERANYQNDLATKYSVNVKRYSQYINMIPSDYFPQQ
jgi:TATA-box binding protein (TBP) (component of TFIID and TFIIIB)